MQRAHPIRNWISLLSRTTNKVYLKWIRIIGLVDKSRWKINRILTGKSTRGMIEITLNQIPG